MTDSQNTSHKVNSGPTMVHVNSNHAFQDDEKDSYNHYEKLNLDGGSKVPGKQLISEYDVENGDYDVDSMFAEEEEEDIGNKNFVYVTQRNFVHCCRTYSSFIWKIVVFLCLVGYTVYFAFAISYNVQLAKSLIIITCVVILLIIYTFIRDKFGEQIYKNCWSPLTKPIANHWGTLQW